MFAEPIACLRCTFPRTTRMGEMRVCFQCRFSWRVRGRALAKAAAPVLSPAPTNTYFFTRAELARLESYRLAVLVGFYSDALTTPYRVNSQVSATRS